MTYKPSPKPNFFKPTHIDYNKMETYLWGDNESGNVRDWIFVSNESLHQIIFGIEPGEGFKHSEEYRTIFGADELMYVLSGTMIITNPETGETHRVTKGNSVFFKKDTWHHAFNYSPDYLQVLEYFSPPPLTGTSGMYAKKKKLLENSLYERNNYFYPSKDFIPSKSFRIINQDDYIWSLNGPNQEVLIGTIVKTENLIVKNIKLFPNKVSHSLKFDKCISFLSLDSNIRVSINNEKNFNLNSKDGLYIPSNTEFRFDNLNNHEANLIFCVGIK